MMPLGAVVQMVDGKDVVVMGSAPLVAGEGYPTGAVTWAVNGGISSLPGPTIDIWNVNARAFEPQSKVGLHRSMLAQAAGRTITLAICNQREGDAVPIFLKKMARQRTVIGSWLAYDSEARDKLGQLTKGLSDDMAKHAPSAGMLSAAMACYCGARSVWLRGFSWRAGYQYLPGVKVPARGHVSIDKMMLGNLLRRYPGVVQTSLALPPRYWTREDFMAAAKGEVAADRAAGVARVRALKMGIYNGQRRRTGSEFTLLHPSHFRESWMEPVVPNEAPPPASLPDPRDKHDVRQRELRREHARLASGQQPKLDHAFNEIKEPTPPPAPTGDADVV